MRFEKSSLWAVAAIGALSTTGAAMATDVAILAAASSNTGDSRFTDPQAKLQATGRFTSVDIINASLVTPTLNELQNYDAVIVWSNVNFADAAALGDVLADYVDAGGGVVIAVFANSSTTSNRSLTGRWTPDYDVIIPRTGSTSGQATLGNILEPGHPLIAGVNTFSGGTSSFRPTGTGLTAGSTLVAEWSDGKILCAAGAIPNRADLGMYPPSSDASSSFWDSSTDGDILMANALEYVAGGGGYRLSVTGSCPGRLTIAWSGAQGGIQQALVYGQREGSTTIPTSKPCSGTVLGVTGQVQLVDPPGFFGTGNDGSGSINGNAGAAACGGRLQLVQGGSCITSNVAAIP